MDDNSTREMGGRLEEWRKKLNRFTTEMLVDFLKYVTKDEKAEVMKKIRPRKSEIIEYLLKAHTDKLEQFFNNLQKLEDRNISMPHAKQSIARKIPEGITEIEKVKRKEELLLLLYKYRQDIDKCIEDIKFEAYVNKTQKKWRYKLEKSFSTIPLENLEKILSDFVNEWNSSSHYKIKIKPRRIEKDVVQLVISKEYGMRPYEEFLFRFINPYSQPKDAEDLREVPVPVYPLSYGILQIKPLDSNSVELTFNFDPKKRQNRDLLELLLSRLFMEKIIVEDLQKIVPKIIEVLNEEVRQILVSAEDADSALKSISEIIEKTKREAIEKVEKSELDEDKKTKIKDMIANISLGGFRIPEKDLGAGVIKLEVIVDLEKFQKNIPNAKDFIEDLIEKYRDNLQPVLLLNEKPITLGAENLPNILNEEEMEAITFFMGDKVD